MEPEWIEIDGARQHNLRIEHLAIPKKKLVVFTGVSGSGKTSLAFDTLYAEGQRRYVESLSSYARQFLGVMEKPAFEKLRGLSPTIAIEQKSASNNPRSTVGTITEIYDYLRVLYARIGIQHCPRCEEVVAPLTIEQAVRELREIDRDVWLLATIVENRKGEHREVLEGLRQRGFLRVLVDGTLERLDSLVTLTKARKHTVQLVVDRVNPHKVSVSRLTDSVETAMREGQGSLLAVCPHGRMPTVRLSQHRACGSCGIGLPDLSPQSFSFNSPLGMCPTCHGMGRRWEMDARLVVPNESLSIRQGAIEPWASIMERGSGWSYEIFSGLEKAFGIDFDRPWKDLSKKQRDIVLRGTQGRRIEIEHRHRSGSGTWSIEFEGVLNTMLRRYSETRSDAMREYYQKYFSDAPCSDCEGRRLRKESLSVRVGGRSIAEVVGMSVDRAREHFEALSLHGQDLIVAREILREIKGRLDFLRSVGLGYLSLDRAGPSLSGGEAQRIRLASQLGSELSGVMYVLDEPSIGLHARDNLRLFRTLERLRDTGNTVLVVEHDAQMMLHADYVVDFGPGAGEQGGQVVFSGTPEQLRASDTSTAQYLSGKKQIALPWKRRKARGKLVVRGARANNLKGIDVAFPLGTLIAVTGVSGAGKSSLITGILFPALARQLHQAKVTVGEHDRIDGIDAIDKCIHIDQSPIGRTPRSNPATYTKAFDLIRDIFSRTPEARALGYGPGRFSFNVRGGRCEACEGDGMKRVEMHFLADVYVPCETCGGKRYHEATLRVQYRGMSIADVLALSVDRAKQEFSAHPKLTRILQTLWDVGLDYVKLGQPAPTLSGGEAQRVKLSRELARTDTGKTLYVLDEPTTGLHFEDIHKLLGVIHRLVQAGNTVIVIEHNLDVIKCADHVIDLGPEGGDQGGFIVAQGTPEQVASHRDSATGHALCAVLPP